MFRSPRPSFVVALILLSALASAVPSYASEIEASGFRGTPASVQAAGEALKSGIEQIGRWIGRILAGDRPLAAERPWHKGGSSLDPWGLVVPTPDSNPVPPGSGP